MKLVTVITLLAIGLGYVMTRGLEGVNSVVSKPEIEANGVAFHCVKAIPEIWKAAKDSGDDFEGVPEPVMFKAFEVITTNYCVCNGEKFGNSRSSQEKKFFGQLAGLNLKLQFQGRMGKAKRARLEKEAGRIVKANRSLLKKKPKWLKKSNEIFRTCRLEQRLSEDFGSFVSR